MLSVLTTALGYSPSAAVLQAPTPLAAAPATVARFAVARSGVTRRICSHSLGNKKEKLAKIECLDALLKRDGDRGLHPHILKMWQPLVVRLPKPVTLGVQGAARQIALASHSAHGTGPA